MAMVDRRAYRRRGAFSELWEISSATRCHASLAVGGFLMSTLPIRIIVVTTLAFALGMDSLKLAVFARIRID
jgi:hypothetical protein